MNDNSFRLSICLLARKGQKSKKRVIKRANLYIHTFNFRLLRSNAKNLECFVATIRSLRSDFKSAAEFLGFWRDENKAVKLYFQKLTFFNLN